MSDKYKSKEQLMLELEDKQRKPNELDSCRLEFERAQRRYNELLEAAPDALIFVNHKYEVVMVNAQTEKLFGYSTGELPGRKIDVLIPERFRQRHKQHINEYFSNPRMRTMGSGVSIFGLKKDGSEFRADISLSPIQTDEGLLVTAAIRDITEHFDVQERLAQSEKLAALGRISSNVAHELRNPLTSIGGFARRLLAGLKEGSTEKEYAGFIVSEVIGLEKTLKDVLDYSRIVVPHLEKHDINALISEVLIAYDEAFRENNILVKTELLDISSIMVDKEQAEQAIGNLVSNAVDAMPHGGELTISSSIESVESRQYQTVVIKDNSAGMPSDMLDKIFEPFFTTKISKKGVGLGLPIAKKIMEDHHGFITVKSLPGKGSAFSIYFPLNEE